MALMQTRERERDESTKEEKHIKQKAIKWLA